MKSKRIIDNSNFRKEGYYKAFFFRKSEIKNEISVFKWIWLTIIELLVGVELLENIITTGSVPPYKTIGKEDSAEYGAEYHLNNHIPSGLVTNFLRKSIIELLFFKHFKQYCLLLPVSKPEEEKEAKVINCTTTRFRARKSVFYQLIAFRRIYEFLWIIFNLLIDVFVYYFSRSIEWTLLSAMLIESIRRLLRI